MFKMILSAIVALGFSAAAFAQDAGAPAGDKKMDAPAAEAPAGDKKMDKKMDKKEHKGHKDKKKKHEDAH